MKTLELKELSPYLPYGIKCIDRKNQIWNLNYRNIEFAIEKQWKPLLIPFEKSLHIEEFTDLFSEYSLENLKLSFYALGTRSLCWKSRLDLEQYEWLLENHYDVFDLIKDDLAADINFYYDTTVPQIVEDIKQEIWSVQKLKELNL